jgi:hypothetical protein
MNTQVSCARRLQFIQKGVLNHTVTILKYKTIPYHTILEYKLLWLNLTIWCVLIIIKLHLLRNCNFQLT